MADGSSRGFSSCVSNKYKYDLVLSLQQLRCLRPHPSAQCTKVKSDKEQKKERRLALCYSKFHAFAIIRRRQTIMKYNLIHEHLFTSRDGLKQGVIFRIRVNEVTIILQIKFIFVSAFGNQFRAFLHIDGVKFSVRQRSHLFVMKLQAMDEETIVHSTLQSMFLQCCS